MLFNSIYQFLKATFDLLHLHVNGRNHRHLSNCIVCQYGALEELESVFLEYIRKPVLIKNKYKFSHIAHWYKCV